MLPKGYRPHAALGSGDFPCKWRFDIKTLCLRPHRSPAVRALAPPAAGLSFSGKSILICWNGDSGAAETKQTYRFCYVGCIETTVFPLRQNEREGAYMTPSLYSLQVYGVSTRHPDTMLFRPGREYPPRRPHPARHRKPRSPETNWPAAGTG